MPSNLVIGGAATAGQATVELPGLSGSPDLIPPALQFDEEFDQNTAGVPAGWTSMNAPAVVSTNEIPSHLHLHNSDNNQNVCRGIFRALPGGLVYPLTITAKVSEGFQGLSGIIVSAVAPGNAGTGYGLAWSGGAQGMVLNMSALSLVGNGNNTGRPWTPKYLRIQMPDSTHVNSQYADSGFTYQVTPTQVQETLSGAAGFLTLFVNTLNSNTADVCFDWVRIK
jgi:hypothetical protein